MTRSSAQAPPYSTQSLIGELLDHPEATAVMLKHVPDVFADSQIEHARDLQFSFIARDIPGLTAEILARMDADLATVTSKPPAKLPPEAKAAVLVVEIDDALESGDEATALAKLRELDAFPVARPSILYLTEAKLARRAEEYARARIALGRYFDAVRQDDSSYGDAVREKARHDALVAEEASAWIMAQVDNTCESYVKYLTGPTRLKKSEAVVLERLDHIGCTGAEEEMPESLSRDLAELRGLKVAGYSGGETIQDGPRYPELMVVKGGFFTMGSPDDEAAGHPLALGGRDPNEGPQRRVGIRTFAVGRFAVTFDEWAACVADGGVSGYSPSDNGWGRGRRPVVHVSWDDAQAYVRWLSERTGKAYRLLSEAEWEYAARAGTTTTYWTGETITSAQANFDSAIGGTQPVGSYPANPFGLFDMTGNVWEWVEDCWSSSHADAPTDGSARTTPGCPQHVLRGASWVDAPLYLRSAARTKGAATMRFINMGFRVARSLDALS